MLSRRLRPSVIELIGIEKHFGDRRALGPLSLQVRPGEVVGLAGLNGAGKTTALRILAGDLAPSAGSAIIFGRDLLDDPTAARALIGFAPDTPPLHDEMTVESYLCFAARLRGSPRADAMKQARAILGRTGLLRVGDAVIGSLSHGFRKRIGIAQALVHGPRVVLLDEPTSGLDPAQISETREVLRNLGRDQAAIVSSHLLGELREICSRIVVLHEGRMAEDRDDTEAWNERVIERILVALSAGAGSGEAAP